MIMGLLMVSIGFHWSLLQTVAWAGMFVKYSQETSSVCEALSRTFDGSHPCRLCEVVRSGKAAEKKSDQVSPLKKCELFVASAEVVWVDLPSLPNMRAPSNLTAPARTETPPVPPPKAV
jgi:hypothetical protein